MRERESERQNKSERVRETHRADTDSALPPNEKPLSIVIERGDKS